MKPVEAYKVTRKRPLISLFPFFRNGNSESGFTSNSNRIASDANIILF